MNDALKKEENLSMMFSLLNVNLTIVCRMIQRQSPFKIRLRRIREYDTPFGVNIFTMKVLFCLLTLYNGCILTRMNYIDYIIYTIYWFLSVYWWYYFSICDFKKNIYIGVITTVIAGIFTCFTQMWFPLLCWSLYALYISIWYNMSYVNTNFIFS